jgi:redox-sensitive bicupin YhaK (pirin superfamily)
MLIEWRPVKLSTRTGIEVRRTLPHAKLKMIGAWCFVDHFGPTKQTDGMVVAAHPHTGLQTVTWLIEGRIEHRDSIGSVQLIEPGQLNLMTSGHGISHSEISLADSELLHAVQLWVALPKDSIDTAPQFEHQANLPKFQVSTSSGGQAQVTVLAGELAKVSAPTKTFSPLMGAELRIAAGESVTLKLNSEFEYGFMPAEGSITIGDETAPTSSVIYRAAGENEITIRADQDAIILMLGGKPFGEKILMWWNFIGRSNEEIVQARNDWNNRAELNNQRFTDFEDSIGGWIPAPEMPNVTLQPR